MKKYILFFLLIVFSACNRTKNNTELLDEKGILIVDVTKKYPKSDAIFIQEIAEVEYIPLETNNDFLCHGNGVVAYIDDNIIIFNNKPVRNILIFDRKGNALRRINRQGQGGEEYVAPTDVAFDKESNELYVNDVDKKKIFVYDIIGNYKRSFEHINGKRYTKIYNFNKEALLCYDRSAVEFDEQKYPFTIISKHTGERIKEVDIPFEKRISERYIFRDGNNTRIIGMYPIPEPAIELMGNAFVLNEISSDTIYQISKDYSMTPLIAQTPSVQQMGENPHYLCFIMGANNYQFMFTQKKEFNPETNTGFPTQALVYDRKKDEIFEQNFYNRDRSGESFDIISGNNNQSIYDFQPVRLKKYLENGELSGQLKEIAEKINEDDNPVLMIITFKKQ